MSVKSMSLLVLFLVFLAGSAAGFLVGGYTGSSFGVKLILSGTLKKDAKDAETQVIVLRSLHGGDTEQAIELLEASLDDQLVIFDPQEPYPVDDDTQARVDSAIKSARSYRGEFPRQSSRPHVDEMVRNLFDRYQ